MTYIRSNVLNGTVVYSTIPTTRSIYSYIAYVLCTVGYRHSVVLYINVILKRIYAYIRYYHIYAIPTTNIGRFI